MPQQRRHPWHRLLRSHLLHRPPQAFLFAISGTLLISSAAILTSAISSERFKNTLLTRFVNEKINQIARNLETETLDWAVWDETDSHLKGSNADYYQKQYNRYSFARTPFVVALTANGGLFSSSTWDTARQRPMRLSQAHEQEILKQIPGRDPLQAATFLARYQGHPFLFSAQPVHSPDSAGHPSGRLMFVRRLDGGDISFKDSKTLNTALGVTNEYYGQPSQASWNPFASVEVAIPLKQWQGIRPMQLIIQRSPNERLFALKAIGLLLLSAGGLVTMVNIRSSIQKRHLRLLDLQNQRRRNHIHRQLEHRRQHDELTGLLSEQGLLHAMHKQASRFSGFQRALVHIDLDHFSVLTNGLGRQLGDQALKAFALALRNQLHPSSALARIGADEFACSLIGTSETSLRSEVTALNAKLNDMNLQVDDQIINVTVSIGAAMIEDARPEQSLHEASVACSIVKLEGGRGQQFFGDSLGNTSNYLAYQQANQDLITAIHEDRLELHAQSAWLLEPAEQYRPVYVELLCRIRDRDNSLAYWNEKLIYAAHLCGSLPLLDQHILRLSFRTLALLLPRIQQAQSGPYPTFAINITADTLLASNFSQSLESLLDEHSIDPELICLEITEQAALRDPALAITSMKRLRKIGFKLALDDFGTGTTSLDYLRDLPLDFVKIDKSFITKLEHDRASDLIVQFVVELGKEIGFQTIAEGVENIPLLLKLEALGISIAQGYVVTKPQPLLSNDNPLFFLETGSVRIGAICTEPLSA
ncbi:MAG: EAL domain-containing protein [Vulcanococcus sp.]